MARRKKMRFKKGDQVQYTSLFLRSTGQVTGAVPHAIGTIESVKCSGKGSSEFCLATIDWCNPGARSRSMKNQCSDVPKRVNTFNLKLLKAWEAN